MGVVRKFLRFIDDLKFNEVPGEEESCECWEPELWAIPDPIPVVPSPIFYTLFCADKDFSYGEIPYNCRFFQDLFLLWLLVVIYVGLRSILLSMEIVKILLCLQIVIEKLSKYVLNGLKFYFRYEINFYWMGFNYKIKFYRIKLLRISKSNS